MSAEPRPVGRPRDPAVATAILEATMRLLAEVGSADLTIERVASEAGVGKATIYRRYADKTELVLAALERQLPAKPDLPETDDTRNDLIELVAVVQQFFVDKASLFATMLLERIREPEWTDSFRDRFVMPRRAVFTQVIRRGQEAGRLRRDFAPSVAVDYVMGAVLESYLLHGPNDQRTPEQIVDSLWPLIAADARR